MTIQFYAYCTRPCLPQVHGLPFRQFVVRVVTSSDKNHWAEEPDDDDAIHCQAQKPALVVLSLDLFPLRTTCTSTRSGNCFGLYKYCQQHRLYQVKRIVIPHRAVYPSLIRHVCSSKFDDDFCDRGLLLGK